MMRYTYLGGKYSVLKGMQCDPVRRRDGKCIRSKKGTMLVTDGEKRHVVVARLLRINKTEEDE